jgi:hypothetical protein
MFWGLPLPALSGVDVMSDHGICTQYVLEAQCPGNNGQAHAASNHTQPMFVATIGPSFHSFLMAVLYRKMWVGVYMD